MAIRPNGVVVALDGTGVEGTLPYATLEGRWDADESGLYAQRAGSPADRLALGQQVAVWCDTVDVEAALLEFRATAARAERGSRRPRQHRNAGRSRQSRSRRAGV